MLREVSLARSLPLAYGGSCNADCPCRLYSAREGLPEYCAGIVPGIYSPGCNQLRTAPFPLRRISSIHVPLTFSREHRQLETDGMPEHETTEMTAYSPQGDGEDGPPGSRDSGLLLIGIFKLGKALLFFCIGAGAIHLLHKDLGDEMLRLAVALKFDPESHIVSTLMEKADLIDSHRLKEISLATFAYSGVALTEGVGLMLQKVWAEYFTLILTVSALPWEMYEIARHPTWFRVALLVINILVLWYLIWLLKRKRPVTNPE